MVKIWQKLSANGLDWVWLLLKMKVMQHLVGMELCKEWLEMTFSGQHWPYHDYGLNCRSSITFRIQCALSISDWKTVSTWSFGLFKFETGRYRDDYPLLNIFSVTNVISAKCEANVSWETVHAMRKEQSIVWRNWMYLWSKYKISIFEKLRC